jgi:aspartyl-tRNA(Asn)/glutamyl-tRNA(Gln) amidotransferase subunit B
VIRYEPVIGLEVHAHLLTVSKLFCGCRTAFGAAPNTEICPVCLGLPGALPVLNRAAVDHAVQAALALGCTIQPTSIFARKNYFYPDLPKGYQISQYEQPLATDGVVKAGSDYWAPEYDIRIKRVHMEEDAGKLVHEGFPDSDRRSYVDLNRAGVPLIEIVTEPDLRSAKVAAAFFGYLRELLMAIGVNDGNMEEGSLRCDANVSVRPAGTETLGTKVEIKNLNSFRFLEKALEYEIERQQDALSDGGRIVQETRLWDPDAGRTFSMRTKEEAHDYRYFPEPDLPPLEVLEPRVRALRDVISELPARRRERFASAFALAMTDVVHLMGSRLDSYFEETVSAGAPPKLAKNWLLGTVLEWMHDQRINSGGELAARLAPTALSNLLTLIDQGTISGTIAKDVFAKMVATGRSAADIVHAESLTQIDDESQIVRLIVDVVAKNSDAVAQVRAGKSAAFGFLVGQVMKAAGGKANPARVNALLKKELGV